MATKIDKMPPEITGSTKKDLDNIIDYLCYLRETVNFALQTIEQSINEE